MTLISSVQNSHIKEVVNLSEKSRIRKEKKLFVLEGKREIDIALKAGYTLQKVFIQEELYLGSISDLPKNNVFKVSSQVYEKIAYRSSTEGVVAVVEQHNHELSRFKIPNHPPLILVLEGIEKPGNLGAIFRTADAANVDAVLLIDCLSDLYNPNCLRSSLGCALSVPSYISTAEAVQAFFKTNNIESFAATLQNSCSYLTQDYKQGTAFILGSEASGLGPFWRTNASKNIIIPMGGMIDSMNVSVAASVLVFEAIRQRTLL